MSIKIFQKLSMRKKTPPYQNSIVTLQNAVFHKILWKYAFDKGVSQCPRKIIFILLTFLWVSMV